MQNRSLKLVGNFLTANSEKKVELKDTYVLETDEKGIITKFEPVDENTPRSNFFDLSGTAVLFPGLIDAHLHLPQYPIIGQFEGELLQWLKRCTFPAEIKFADQRYAQTLIKDFFAALKTFGTTTAAIFSSIHTQSTDMAFAEAERSNLRIIMGKVMMDQQSPSELTETTLDSLKNSHALATKWNKKTEKLFYAYSPRFAITTSEGLMTEVAKVAKQNDNFIQTHFAENLAELKQVKELYPDRKDYLDVYDHVDLLGPKTLLAHCIHVTDRELKIIADTKTKIIHCPDSNFFLGSGRFPIEKMHEYHIDFGLGSDIGAGTTLNMFKIMKSMVYMQNLSEKYKVTPEEAFYHATLGNAKILGFDNIIGSIEKGKRAEFGIINMAKIKGRTAREVLSELLFKDDYKIRDVIM